MSLLPLSSGTKYNHDRTFVGCHIAGLLGHSGSYEEPKENK